MVEIKKVNVNNVRNENQRLCTCCQCGSVSAVEKKALEQMAAQKKSK